MAYTRKYPWDRRPLIARALSSRSSSTADIYFAWSFAEHLKAGDIQRLAPTVFLIDRTLIVMRHDAGLRQVPEFDKLIYFCDDDWRSGIKDPRIPREYRTKLRLVEAHAAGRLEKYADIIVVPSRVLLDVYKRIYPNKQIRIVTPAWRSVAQPHSLVQDENVQIAYLGTRSHKTEFDFLVPIVSKLFDQVQNFEFTISGEQRIPRAWADEPRLRVIKAMPWHDYQNWMTGETFDIGLYPLMSGSFALARSANKLLEYDQLGAAVITSHQWRSALPEGVEQECIFLNDDQDSWCKAIQDLIQHPEKRKSMVSASRAVIARQYSFKRQRDLWRQILDSLHNQP